MNALSPATARLVLAAHITRSTIPARSRISPLWGVVAGAVMVWAVLLCVAIL